MKRTTKLDKVQLPDPFKEFSDAEARFVDEFLVDRDPYAAAMRAGVEKINLKRTVGKWMGDPKILQEIKTKTNESDVDTMISPQMILAGFIEVAFDRNAPHAARMAALRELRDMKKELNTRKGEDDERRPGVIFVPGVVSLEDWNKAALAQQQQLKEKVKE